MYLDVAACSRSVSAWASQPVSRDQLSSVRLWWVVLFFMFNPYNMDLVYVSAKQTVFLSVFKCFLL